MQIGAYALSAPVVLAPMAGVTDAVFRRICREQGAGLTVGEMVSSDVSLRETPKTSRRFTVDPDDPMPVVQILGAEPEQMAQAARHAQQQGAGIVDVNFGCPARVVCGKACGSALMQNEPLAYEILAAVRAAVSIPVTVKMRTGWDAQHRNVLELAQMAQDLGYAAVTVHARTRADRFSGTPDYATVARVAKALRIPVVINGDIDSPQKAAELLDSTAAAGVMVGRAAYGNPWLFARIAAVLQGRRDPGEPDVRAVGELALAHFQAHLAYWGGAQAAVRSFRKHARWYMQRFDGGEQAAGQFVRIDAAEQAAQVMKQFFWGEAR